MNNKKERVVITGITGFIGSQVCLAFLQDGTYEVRGTVRDKSNQKRLAPLKEGMGQ